MAITFAIVLVVLLAGIGLGLPYYAGIQTEKHFRQNIETVIQDSPIAIKDYQYQRGLLNAKATTPLELKTAGSTFQIPVEHEIEHGLSLMNPNLAKVVTTVRLPAETPAEIKELFKDQAPLKISTLVGRDSSIRCDFSSPSVDGRLSGENQPEIHWKGINGTVSMSPDLNVGAMTLVAPALSVQSAKGVQFSFEQAGMDGDLKRNSPDGFWLGVSRANCRKISLVERNDQGVATDLAQADNFQLTINVSEKDGALEAVYTFLLEKLKTAGKAFDAGSLEIRFSSLDSQALMKLRDTLRDLNKQQIDDNTRNQETLKVLLELLPKFLARSPEVAIPRLAVGTSDGQIQGDGRLKYIGGQDIQNFQPLKDLEGEAKLTAPKPLVESIAITVAGIGGKDLDEALGDKAEAMKRQMIQEQISGLIAGGIIQDQGSLYSSQVALKGGALTLNGKPIPIPPGS